MWRVVAQDGDGLKVAGGLLKALGSLTKEVSRPSRTLMAGKVGSTMITRYAVLTAPWEFSILTK